MDKIVYDTLAAAELLKSAERHGVPMPYDVAMARFQVPRLLVMTTDDWDAWRAYLDDGSTWEVVASGTQLVLTGTAYECPVTVTYVSSQPGETPAHVHAAILDPQ